MKLIFVPFPVVSHLASAVLTAKLLVDRDQYLSITIIVMKLPTDTKIDSYIENSSRINFLQLSNDETEIDELRKKNPTTFIFRFLESQRESVRDAVAKIMEHSRIVGFVVDFFCTAMIDVADGLKIPTYVFFPSGAAALGLMLDIQSRRDDRGEDVGKYVDSDVELSVPSYVNPVPGRLLPMSILAMGKDFLDNVRRFRKAKGIVVNTFSEFEPHAIWSLTSDEKIPPVYPVGPILQVSGEEGNDQRKEEHDKMMMWLNEQPDESVVFLCFGSTGSFEESQVKEIALALERSGYRFLWSLRKPAPKEMFSFPGEYEDFKEVLPEGFLKRTVERGKVIGWASQVAILSHPAVGGFVTHCGWNSTLESIWCGVPMATWPLAAEQQVNAFQLVRELGLAVEIKMDYRKNSGVILEADMIEKGIRELMDLKNEIRVKVKVMKNNSRMALVEGGSSYECLCRLLEDIKSE